MRALELRVPPVLVTAACAALMWSVAALTPSLAFEMPGRIILTLTFAAVGVVVALMGVVAFRRASTTVNPLRPEAASSLVTSGIYRVTRNPMYLGLLLVLLGWAVFLSHPLPWLGAPLFVAYMNRFQIRPEERHLHVQFGNEFDAYSRSTRRWL